MNKSIVASTEVLLRKVRYAKGTEFAVTGEPKDGQTPVQVDPETARRWIRDGWATEKPGAAPTAAK